MIEIYKDVSGYTGYYQVSNLGNVRSLHRGIRMRSPCKELTGYMRIGLNLNGSQRRHSVHRLVATAFIDNPHNYPYINHIDGDKSNNIVDNLEWCTPLHNARHAIATGLFDPSSTPRKGEDSGGAKLTDDDVRIIRLRVKGGERHVDIADDYCVHRTTVGRISRRVDWSHVL